MSVELTREELFKQVWQQPMVKVAARYGISDVALKKICDKHRIPVPGRGYWAKKAAGKKVQKAHFRTVADPALNRVVIFGSPTKKLPESVRKAKAAARQQQSQQENTVAAGALAAEPHPALSKTLNKLAKAKPSSNGLVRVSGPGLFLLEVAPASIERATAFLHALLQAAEARGYQLERTEHASVFVVDGERLPVQIIETIDRTKHEPTEGELLAQKRWEESQARRRSGDWRYSWKPRPTPPDWDYAPSSKLRFLINEDVYGYSGLRKSFGDGKIQRIETLINPILEALAGWAAAIKEKRIEDELRRQRWQEEERKRKERRRLEALEAKRVETLSKSLKRRRESDQVRQFVAEVQQKLAKGNCENPDEVREWINWALTYADRLDPLANGLPRLLHFDDFEPWELY